MSAPVSSKALLKRMKRLFYKKKRNDNSGDPNTLDTPLLADQLHAADAAGAGEVSSVADAPLPVDAIRASAQGREISEDTLGRPSVAIPQLPAQLFNDTVFNATNMDHEHRYAMASDYISDAMHNRNLQVVPTDNKQKIALAIATNWFYDGLIGESGWVVGGGIGFR